MPSPRPTPRLLDSLLDGIAALGLSVADEAPSRLLDYMAELEQWNAAYNLTAIRDPAVMIARHLLDCLTLLPFIGDGPVLDVGSGAGLPALVLAIARPQLRVDALDSNGKKARFLRHAVRHLRIANAGVIETRAEDHRIANDTGGYARIVSRAYSSLADFVATTRHLLAPAGEWIAMKGKLDPAELAALPPDCAIAATHRLFVPGLREDRHAVILTLNQAP